MHHETQALIGCIKVALKSAEGNGCKADSRGKSLFYNANAMRVRQSGRAPHELVVLVHQYVQPRLVIPDVACNLYRNFINRQHMLPP